MYFIHKISRPKFVMIKMLPVFYSGKNYYYKIYTYYIVWDFFIDSFLIS